MKKMWFERVAAGVIGVVVLSGCASKPRDWVWATRAATDVKAPIESEAPPARPAWRVRGEGEIAPGFELEITCPADRSVGGIYRVEADGALKMPYKVQVDAHGISTEALATELDRAYRPYIRSPNFSVAIKKRSYFVDVQGLVTKPGPVLVKSESSLDEIIAGAGGLQQTPERQAQAQYVRVVQGAASGTFKLRDYFAGSLTGLPVWQGGEKIFFQSEGGPTNGKGKVARRYINILGQVRSPGEYPYEHGDFHRYLIQAGGPTDRADLDNISLIRMNGDSVGTRTFTVHEPTELPTLESGDTVIVQADNPSPLEKRSRVIGGFMSILTSIATVVLLFVVV
ncbi:MAG: hypothetical protein RL417_928 [Pseudomonadota bacterium]